MPPTSRLTEPARRVLVAQVVDSPLDAAEHTRLVASPEAGAVASFAGVIRDHDHGQSVIGIDYVAHPSANEVIASIAADIVAGYPLDGLAVSHRIGHLDVGEVALAAAVSAAHRGEAFAALAELVEQIKLRLPVWKHQFLTDGGQEWVGLPQGAQPPANGGSTST